MTTEPITDDVGFRQDGIWEISPYLPSRFVFESPISICEAERREEAKRTEKWDRRFLKIAEVVSGWSKDPSTKCGAVIVDSKNHILSTGYNGFPPGTNDDPEIYNNRELKLARVIHAEQNAILQAGYDLEGCTIYTWPPGYGPSCDRCSAHIIGAGIERVVYVQDTSSFASRWKDAAERGLEMYYEAGVEVVSYERERPHYV